MNTTAQDIYDRVRSEVHIPLDDEDTYTPESFMAHINRAIGVIASKGAVNHAEVLLSVSQETRAYRIPGIKKVISAWMDGKAYNLTPMSQHLMVQDGQRAITGEPRYYAEVNEYIVLHPAPPQPDSLYVYGTFRPPLIETLEQTIHLEQDYADQLDYWVLGHWHLSEGNANESQAYLGMWSDLLKNVRNIEAAREARSLPDQIADRLGDGQVTDPNFIHIRRR